MDNRVLRIFVARSTPTRGEEASARNSLSKQWDRELEGHDSSVFHAAHLRNIGGDSKISEHLTSGKC